MRVSVPSKTKSPCFPASMLPMRSARPRAAAPFSVMAVIASAAVGSYRCEQSKVSGDGTEKQLHGFRSVAGTARAVYHFSTHRREALWV